MIRLLPVALLFLLGPATFQLHAQCVDSTHIQYGAYCDPSYDPVCGCNGYTYKNDCFARNAGLTSWVYNICDPVDFDFNPNPPYDVIYVDALLKNPGDMYVQLTDTYGHVFYTNVFPSVQRYQFQIDIKGFPIGVYFLDVYCADGYRVKKVVLTGLN